MKVAVVGLGKIGLPLAVQYASRGIDVAGCDIDADRVERINADDCPIEGEDGLEEGLSAALKAGRLRATTDSAAAVAASDIVVLIVPVGLTAERQPDFTQLDSATQAVAAGVRSGTLVVVETTVPVGTTRGRVGSKMPQGVLLAASPERVSSGRILRDLRTYPKLVGAVDDASWQRAEAFYEAALDAPCITRVSDPETAEFAKLAEGIYRDLNIALAGELARYADEVGIDVTEAIGAANSQPYSRIHDPGVGVGGHCLPVYPHFLPDGAVDLAARGRAANDAMAAYAVEKLASALGALNGATVLVLGLSYRPNVKEHANSSALLLVQALRERGARALVHDPLYSDEELRSFGLEPATPFPPEQIDALVVQALHDSYGDLDFGAFSGCRAVLDGRNALDPAAIREAGLIYLGVGR